ncbi:MAG: insulinase family protein [Deltaproteobacteria bacterium]|nr:insulinase family protein [Deltaproteobacteria bacterium]
MPFESIPLEVERHTLDNGLKVNLHRDTSLPLVTLNLWYHVGSKNERPGRTGFAHLFEHMLFQGSEHVDTNDHFRYIQQVGGVVNGSTWYDRTNYYETLPSQHLDLGLWLESDRMGFLLPAITQEKLENQRSVVMNERRQRVDNRPYGRAYERLHEMLFPELHPYHWPVIGYMEDIAAATLEDVQSFFSTYYAPNNAVLTVAGDFETEKALESIRSYFEPIPAAAPIAAVEAELPPMTGEQREVIEDDIQLPRIYLGFRAPAYGERLWYAADLLTRALAGGKSSPLYEDLVYRRQIAQDVSAHVFPTEIAATCYFVATCKPGVEPAELEKALFEHLARAASEPLTDAELDRPRNQILSGYYQSLQPLDRRADLLSEFTTYFDDPGRVRLEPENYLRLEAEDLKTYASTFLKPDQRVVLTFVPRTESATRGDS